jgi:hypothetical protein
MGLILFSRAGVYGTQIVIVLGIVAFARKIAAENHKELKRSAVIEIDGSWDNQKNGMAYLCGIVDVDSRRVVESEIIEKVNASGQLSGKQ